jgi:uncharacterized protein
MKGKTVIMKPVSILCNGRCDYCYNLTVSFRTQRAMPKMKLETARRVQQELLDMGYDRIRLVWHGGEPLLRGIQFYEEVVAQQTELRLQHPELRLENGMQSNLTLLTREWCEFLKANHFVVGTSLDGWAELHNAHRKYASGRGQFDDTYRGLKLADEYGILGGFIAVVTDATVKEDPRRYFEYLVSACPRAEITPCWEAGEGYTQSYTVKPAEFLPFAKEMFDAWWELNDPQRRVRMFDGFMQALLGGLDYTCSFKGNCGDFLSVEADGSVYPCGKFSGVPEYYLGNVVEQSLTEILENPVYAGWLAQRTNLPNKCKECKWAKVCNNGCTYERYLGERRFAEVAPFCEVWAGLYEHVQDRIQTLQYALAQRSA